jgi:DNA-binding transcriptional MerR regulator
VKVSELAARSGLSPKTIRFYESEGILPPAARRENGYREYDDEDLCRVRLVAALRQLGLRLGESGDLAAMCATGRCDDMTVALATRIAERRREVASARAELDHLDAELEALERGLAVGEPQPTLCIGKEDEHASLRLPVRA